LGRAVAGAQPQPAIAALLGVPQALQRRRGRGQHHQRPLDLGAGHGQVAGLVDEALLLLERAVVLLVDHHQPQLAERQEQGRAGPDHDPRRPVATPSQARRRLGGETPGVPLDRGGAEPGSKRAITAWVRAISGSRISTWLSGSAARAAATASR
jgi:hypothetical protein